ncbi:MAG: Gfo/Idh/MocA family oxidoreductase [bacterium]|nr:Gfo/Idh/MocA family oxidoreductase [bacterium]
MGDPVKVAVVGLGQRGLQHLKALWKLQKEGAVEIAALGDAFEGNLTEEKISKFVPGFVLGSIPTFTQFDELYAKTRLDALHMVIPPGFHKGEIVRAVADGVHIFAEKPMSLFFDEAIEMERAIRKSGVIATAGFQRRYEPFSVVAHRFFADKRPVMTTMISEGFLEQHSVKHTQTQAIGGPRDKVWAKNAAWSGMTVVEAGIHQTDLMRFWFGDIKWVQSAYVPRDANDVEDGGDNPYAYTVTYGFENGAVGNLLMSRLRKVYHTGGYQIAMWDHGHLVQEGKEAVAYYYEGSYPPAKNPSLEAVRHVLDLPEPCDTTYEINRGFIEAVQSKDDSKMLNTFASSMNSLAAVLAANVSHMREGERIHLDAFQTSDSFAPYRQRPEGM